MSQKSLGADIYDQAKEHGVLVYGDQTIHYDVIRKAATSNSARQVQIKVNPDQGVVATAPHDASAKAIQQALLKRARWIWQNLNEFAKQKDYVVARQYVSGETQFYLGKRYPLKVFIEPNQKPSVKLSKGRLNVTLSKTPQDRKSVIKPLIDNWYKQKAKSLFSQRLAALLPKTDWVKQNPSFRVLAMKKQWGSCSVKGNLMLNPHLIKAPKACIDYVILHELCHIAEHNHSENFWRLLSQIMPEYQTTKAKLDAMAELYLNE